jgi:hypothetical protein
MAAGVLAVGLVVGCGATGPKRLRLSGAATFDGKPIPYGDVIFTPDGSKQNSGPQGVAEIRDGRYDTSGSDGKGYAGGPTVVHVIGLTAPGGKLLCEYEYQVDLPREDGTHDIEVPKKGAAGAAKNPDDI